jgi:hypothetical protein
MVQRPDPTQYNYDPRSLRYRGSNGRYVSAKQVRASVDQLIDAEALTMRQHAQDMLDGKINFAEWQLRSLATIKTLHTAMGIAGNGGKNNTSPSDYAAIGNMLKEQYKYFRGMVADIRRGKQPLNSSLLARVALYGQAGRKTYEAVRVRAGTNTGLKEMRNILGPSDHCHGASNGCIEQNKRGWVPIGDLVPVGERLCGPNCHCSVEMR